MLISRRTLLSRGSTLLTGVVLLPLAGSSATSTPRITTSVPLSPADEIVLNWVRTYATAVRFAGSGVVGKLRGSAQPTTHLLARVDNRALLPTVLTGPLPFDGARVFAKGNTVTFTFAGTDFTIENLTPAAFTAALAARAARATTSLATDGVTWDPATQTLSDPFHGTGVKSLKLVNPGTNLAAVFTTLLRSLAESDAANVDLDASFNAYRRRILARTSISVAESAGILRELIRQLPAIADCRSRQEVRALLLTPMVNNTLWRQLRLVSAKVVAQFDALRLATTASDAGVWLAVLLAPQIRLGTAGLFAGGLAPERLPRFLAALAEAIEIK